MNDIHSLTPEELAADLGLSPPFRGVQLFKGIHRDLAVSYDQITALPFPLRTRLASSHPLDPYSIDRDLTDSDGTRKLLVRFPDGLGVEMVRLLDEHGRATACVSTQIGCAMGCRFCRTAGMGLKRNLSAGEIVIQR
jgi:23S rRNA (adenine2503-C2)-methyltransferase